MRWTVVLLAGLITGNIFSQKADTLTTKAHLDSIIHKNRYRTFNDTAELNRVALYIEKTFKNYTDSVWVQVFKVNNVSYRNVICSFNTNLEKRIVVGAHYDVCGPQDGADDNASGVAGLLELSRMLANTKTACRVDLVAYTLEEPPFFRTENMGSARHAQYLSDTHAKVEGMISLEMIGFFSNEKKSQSYPIGLLSLFYGKKGDYITVVNKMNAGKFGRRFKRVMKKQNVLPTRSFKAPKKLTGIDFSDHLNYWKFGFRALMVTDTSFYRNKNYHRKTDTVNTLDIKKMCLVINEVYETLKWY